jgi:hypothetical protein
MVLIVGVDEIKKKIVQLKMCYCIDDHYLLSSSFELILGDRSER